MATISSAKSTTASIRIIPSARATPLARATRSFPLGSLGGYGSGSRLSTFEQISPTRVQVVSVNWLTTFSPTEINEVRFGYSRFRTSFNSADATPGNPNFIDPAALGLDMGTGHVGLPEIDFNGDLENLGATAYSVPRGRVSETFQVLDNFTLTHGRNTFKFGGEFHRYDVQSFNDNLERGLLDVNTCFYSARRHLPRTGPQRLHRQ